MARSDILKKNNLMKGTCMFLYLGITLLTMFVFLTLWAIGIYNKLIRGKALVEEGSSGINVQLKRRYDLIPNLVAVVKQYSIHEQQVLENVTKLRANAINAQTFEQKIEAEKGLTGALKTLFAVAENYPELKANENFMHLQKELASLEHEIQLARRYYNGTARNYNVVVHSFPTNIIAKMYAFGSVPYFQTSEQETETPQIKF